MDVSSIGAAGSTVIQPQIRNTQAGAAVAPAKSLAETRPTTSVQSPPPTAEQLKAAVDEVQKALAPVARDLQFSIDHDSGKTVVKVVDSETNKVLRQFPSEEMLNLAKALDKFQGLLVKQEA